MIENKEVEVYFNLYLLLINYWNAAAGLLSSIMFILLGKQFSMFSGCFQHEQKSCQTGFLKHNKELWWCGKTGNCIKSEEIMWWHCVKLKGFFPTSCGIHDCTNWGCFESKLRYWVYPSTSYRATLTSV